MNGLGSLVDIQLFAGSEMDAYLKDRMRDAAQEIDRIGDDAFMATDADELATQLNEIYVVEALVSRPDLATLREMQFDRVSTSEISRAELALCIPFTGTRELLTLRCYGLMWSPRCRLEADKLCFPLRNAQSKTQIDHDIQQTKDHLTEKLKSVANLVDGHNADLRARLPKLIRQRRSAIARRRELFGSLSVPFERDPSPAETFVLPLKESRKELKIAPTRSGMTQLAPVVSQQTFLDILKTIHDFGVHIERHPTIYRDKDEPALRDLLLLILSANFKGPVSSTGETLNASGKTDILLRYENSNVFIAECLLWKGKEYLEEKIDQLATYLTWRDTKAALVVFVKTSAVEPVVAKAKKAIQDHPRFVRWGEASGDTPLAVMAFPGDKDRHALVALLIFHFPNQ